MATTTAPPSLNSTPLSVLPKSISYHNFTAESPNHNPLTSSATSSPAAVIVIGNVFRGSNNTSCDEEDKESEEEVSSEGEEKDKVAISELEEDEILSKYHQKHTIRQQQLQLLTEKNELAKEKSPTKDSFIPTTNYKNDPKKSLTFFSTNKFKSKSKPCVPTSKTIAHSIGLANEEEEEFEDVYDEELGKKKDKKSGSNRRGLPLNASFSSWLQLFLSRKRCNGQRGGVVGINGQRSMMRSSVSLSVVHESSGALGSDGESLEVSPCTSDQMSTSSFYPCSSSMYERDGDRIGNCQYVPNVKMRQKANNRRWSEQDIQKRLSLPADIKLPQTVVDKLNRTPTLDNPLTRKSRRASLSEIGFGKLETYKKIFDLGEGTYATVYLGKSLLTGKSVALKEIRLEHEEGAPCTAIREVSLLRNLKHANVVTLHDIIYTERVLTLVFEFVEHDLREYMEEIESMICMNNVKLFLVQLLRGLAYCHKRRILHRDLKPQNLLINRAGELKLADFGLARAQSVPTKTYSNEVVTLWYRPPDVLLGSTDYSTHIDMWGVGCILFEMLEHKPLFPGSTTDEQLNLIFQKLGTPSPEIYPNLCALPLYKSSNHKQHSVKSLNSERINQERADLLLRMLRYDGRSRIQAVEALRHPMLATHFPPDAVLSLADTESVLSLPGVNYTPEQPGVRKPAK